MLVQPVEERTKLFRHKVFNFHTGQCHIVTKVALNCTLHWHHLGRALSWCPFLKYFHTLESLPPFGLHWLSATLLIASSTGHLCPLLQRGHSRKAVLAPWLLVLTITIILLATLGPLVSSLLSDQIIVLNQHREAPL